MMRQKQYNVYKIINSVNDKVYVGRTTRSIERRWKEHMQSLANGDNRHLYCAMRKHGVDKFEIRLIEKCSSFEEMVEKEAFYCEKYEAYTHGYNMTTAGEINPMDCEKSRLLHDQKMRSEDVRSRISASMREVRKNSLNVILIHKGRKGKRVSRENLQKYLDDGWILGSNAVGKIRIYNPTLDRESTIWEDEFKEYAENGWQLGGKPGKITPNQRYTLDSSHFKKVQGVSIEGIKTEIFTNLKEATAWWYSYILKNNIKTPNYIKKRSYGLADYIKKSSKLNMYIFGVKWYYLDDEIKGGDIYEEVDKNKN